MDANVESIHFYLFAKSNNVSGQSLTEVFYTASNAFTAETLCRLFKDSFGSSHEFSARPVKNFSLEQQIRYDEAVDCMAVYSDPDPGVYDPEPSKELHQLAQYSVQASIWEQLIEAKMSTGANDSGKKEQQPDSSAQSW